MRKGKYHKYKLKLLEHLLENDFVIDLENVYGGSIVIANRLEIPKSSWHDITNEMYSEGLILMKFHTKHIGVLVNKATRIQLSKKGLEYLTRHRYV